MFSKSLLKEREGVRMLEPEPNGYCKAWSGGRENGKHRSLGSYREQRPEV